MGKDANITDKQAALEEQLRGYGRLAVAFSGGVDSSLLLTLARDTLDGDAIAVTATSPLFPVHEQEAAHTFCEERGIQQIFVDFNYADVEGLADNPPDRCYCCKQALFARIEQRAAEEGFSQVADGSNVDDMDDYRPGMAALAEAGVASPLRDAGFTKDEIRALAKELGLPSWDTPSCACLATRFAYGEAIDEERLGMVDAAEDYLRKLGFAQVRVRVSGTTARIEIPEEDIPRFMEGSYRQVNGRLRELGFTYVALDLGGYITGNMNREL